LAGRHRSSAVATGCSTGSARSLDAGATLVAIGPYTNLALLEVSCAGSLAREPVVVMGGWVHQQPPPGLPQWGPDMDFNVQWDTRAAEVVAATAQLTLVTLSATLSAQLRRTDLPRLRAAGPVGQLLARQGEAHGQTNQMEQLGREHAALPDDLLNFQYDPVACAVALGWSGAAVADMRMRPVRRDGVLFFEPHPEGRPTRVLLDVDGVAFRETWMSAVEGVTRGS
jgi:purine nucleosidase